MNATRFEYKQNIITRQWRWRLYSSNGKLIAMSNESYFRKAGCEKNAKAVFNGLKQHF